MRMPPVLKALAVLFGLVSIYGLLVLPENTQLWKRPAQSTYYLIIHWQSILPIYSYYYFSKKGMINQVWFKYIAFLFFASAYIQFISFGERFDGDEGVNNKAYLWLSLFPLTAFFSKKPIAQYALVLIIMFFLLTGMKRGALLLGVVATLVVLWYSLRARSRRLRLGILFLSCISVFVIFYYFEQLASSSEFFAGRIEETLAGDSSERDVIYTSYWSFFWSPKSIFSFLLGNGAFGTLKHLGLMAHNDWLEFMIDMGLVGLTIYLIYWFYMGKCCVDSARKCPPDIHLAIVLFAVIYFGKTLFSMSIMEMSFFSTSVFGYCLANYDDVRKQKSLQL